MSAYVRFVSNCLDRRPPAQSCRLLAQVGLVLQCQMALARLDFAMQAGLWLRSCRQEFASAPHLAWRSAAAAPFSPRVRRRRAAGSDHEKNSPTWAFRVSARCRARCARNPCSFPGGPDACARDSIAHGLRSPPPGAHRPALRRRARRPKGATLYRGSAAASQRCDAEPFGGAGPRPLAGRSVSRPRWRTSPFIARTKGCEHRSSSHPADGTRSGMN